MITAGALRRRFSLQARVALSMLLVALAPQLLVFVWSQAERPTPGRLWGAAAAAVDAPTAELADEAGVTRVAEARGVRLRVDRGGDVVDVDRDDPHEPFERVESFFLRAWELEDVRTIDAREGPLRDRWQAAEARRTGRYVGCDYRGQVFCEAYRWIPTPDGEALVVAQASSSRAVGPVYALRSWLLRLSILTFPLAAALAWLTARRIARPIEELKAQAAARAREKTPRLEPQTRDEVHDLAASLNALLDEIDRRRVEHDAFVADLVHDLKSPVASLAAASEVLAERPPDERTARLARSVGASTERLRQIIARFLELSRARAGLPGETRDVVDVARLARECVEDAHDDPRFADVALGCEADAALEVRGVRARLAAILHELVNNAASFTPAGGAIVVRAVRAGDRARLEVVDAGPGIAPADAERVFERYYTTRAQARGTGLGLPIVRAVAEAHGGAARVEPRADGEDGARFVVELPLGGPAG